MQRILRMKPTVLLLPIVLLTIAGCSRDSQQKKIDAAKLIVEQGLNAWLGEETSDSLNTGQAPIQFHDDDWQAGARLVEYQLLDSWVETDQTVRCQVRLTIEYERDQRQEVICAYQIISEPDVIVARDPMS